MLQVQPNRFPLRSLFAAALLGASWGSSFASGSGGPEPRPWTDMINDRGASFYAIQREFHRRMEEEKTSSAARALSKPAAGRRGVEAEEPNLQFLRWERYMGPRVYPGGDLALPSRATAAAAAPYLGLDGAAVVPMAGNWVPVGPMSVPKQGISHQHAGAGRLNFIRVNPSDPASLWVGAPGGGLWASRDAGITWSTATDRLAVLGAADIVIDPANPLVQYLATGDADHDISTRSVGVLKSVDGGATWKATGLSFEVGDQMRLTRLLIHPTQSGTVLVSGMKGIYRTVDGGVKWTQVLVDQVIRDMEFKPGDPDVVYASGEKFFRSVNGGLAFSTVTSVPESYRIAIAVTPANAEAVYLVCANERNFRSLQFSGNAGQTFASRSTSPNILGYDRDGGDDGGQAFYDLGLAASPTNAEVLLVGGINIWKSTNGGRNWSVLTDNNDVHWDVHAIEFQPGSGTTLYAASDGGLYGSKDAGATWKSLSQGLSIAEVNRLGTSPHGDDRILAGLQDNGVHLFDGDVWTHVVGGDGFEAFFDRSDPNSLFAAIQGGYASRSKDGGKTWGTIMGSGMVGPFNTSWQQDPKDANILYWGSTHMWKSANKGVSWTQLAATPGSNPANNILVDPNNTQILYTVKNELIAKSINGGGSWTNITGTLPARDAALFAVAVAPGNSNVLWVALSGYSEGNKVFKSLDGGKTWLNYSQGLPNLPSSTLVPQRDTQGGLYLGMDVGVYFRDQSMDAWAPFFQGLPNVNVQELEIRYRPTIGDSRILAATYGRGLWESPLYDGTPVGARKAPAPAPQAWDAKLDAGSYRVVLTLSGAWKGPLRVEVADLRGRVVRRHGLGSFAGSREMSLELPKGLGKGLYQVILTGPSERSTRPILLP